MCRRDEEMLRGILQNKRLNPKENSTQDDKQAVRCAVSGSVYHSELQRTTTKTIQVYSL